MNMLDKLTHREAATLGTGGYAAAEDYDTCRIPCLLGIAFLPSRHQHGHGDTCQFADDVLDD